MCAIILEDSMFRTNEMDLIKLFKPFFSILFFVMQGYQSVPATSVH
jgi:hypothetical protein